MDLYNVFASGDTIDDSAGLVADFGGNTMSEHRGRRSGRGWDGSASTQRPVGPRLSRLLHLPRATDSHGSKKTRREAWCPGRKSTRRRPPLRSFRSRVLSPCSRRYPWPWPHSLSYLAAVIQNDLSRPEIEIRRTASAQLTRRCDSRGNRRRAATSRGRRNGRHGSRPDGATTEYGDRTEDT